MEATMIAADKKRAEIYESFLRQNPITPSVITKPGYNTMPPAVLADFPGKVHTREMISCYVLISHEVVGFSFHAAPHCPLARSELPLLATNSPGFLSHTRISPTRQAVTWGEIRIGLGKVLARTLRHNVEVLKGMSPHAIISDSRINASSGNASN
jgi:hypothetical protein